MKISFHVPRNSYLDPGFSGDKVFVRSLITGLQRRGHDVDIVSRLKVRNVLRGKLDLSDLLFDAATARKRMLRFKPDACLVFGASQRNPDFICLWQPVARYVLLAADLGSSKKIHKDYRSLFEFTHHESLRRAHHAAAYHPDSYDLLASFGIPEERRSLLFPAPDGWSDIPSQVDARRSLDLPENTPVLFCASRLPEPEPQNGEGGKTEMILGLLRQFAALPPGSVIVIAGDGPGRAFLEQEAAGLLPGGGVRFVGAVDHAEMPRYFAACDFFVYPNATDRPWLAVLEAQSCGVPVVTMRTRSALLTVKDGTTGLLARDLDEFTAHITSLANDRPRCLSMGEAAREYAAANHTVGERLDRIEELLTDSSSQRPTS